MKKTKNDEKEFFVGWNSTFLHGRQISKYKGTQVYVTKTIGQYELTGNLEKVTQLLTKNSEDLTDVQISLCLVDQDVYDDYLNPVIEISGWREATKEELEAIRTMKNQSKALKKKQREEKLEQARNLLRSVGELK